MLPQYRRPAPEYRPVGVRRAAMTKMTPEFGQIRAQRRWPSPGQRHYPPIALTCR